MPLLKCPDCGKEVSDTAPSCPGCGRPIAPQKQPAPQIKIVKKSSGCGLFITIVLAILAAVVMLAFL